MVIHLKTPPPVQIILAIRWLASMDGVVSEWRDRVCDLPSSLEEGLIDLNGLCKSVKEAAAAMNYGE